MGHYCIFNADSYFILNIFHYKMLLIQHYLVNHLQYLVNSAHIDNEKVSVMSLLIFLHIAIRDPRNTVLRL
jgi:hypothetical protein